MNSDSNNLSPCTKPIRRLFFTFFQLPGTGMQSMRKNTNWERTFMKPKHFKYDGRDNYLLSGFGYNCFDRDYGLPTSNI